jgi:hypothetical protein
MAELRISLSPEMLGRLVAGDSVALPAGTGPDEDALDGPACSWCVLQAAQLHGVIQVLEDAGMYVDAASESGPGNAVAQLSGERDKRQRELEAVRAVLAKAPGELAGRRAGHLSPASWVADVIELAGQRLVTMQVTGEQAQAAAAQLDTAEIKLAEMEARRDKALQYCSELQVIYANGYPSLIKRLTQLAEMLKDDDPAGGDKSSSVVLAELPTTAGEPEQEN